MRSSAVAAAVKTDALRGVSKPAKMNIDTVNTTSVAALPREDHRNLNSQKQSTAEQDFDDGGAPGGGSD